MEEKYSGHCCELMSACGLQKFKAVTLAAVLIKVQFRVKSLKTLRSWKSGKKTESQRLSYVAVDAAIAANVTKRRRSSRQRHRQPENQGETVNCCGCHILLLTLPSLQTSRTEASLKSSKTFIAWKSGEKTESLRLPHIAVDAASAANVTNRGVWIS